METNVHKLCKLCKTFSRSQKDCWPLGLQMPSRMTVGPANDWHADAHAESCNMISHMLYIFILMFRVSTGQGMVKFCNPFRISGIRSWTSRICCGGFNGLLL